MASPEVWAALLSVGIVDSAAAAATGTASTSAAAGVSTLPSFVGVDDMINQFQQN